MNWQFTIIDRNNVEHIIPEPVGWDAIEIVISRDLDMHGVFFDYQGNSFEFIGIAGKMIKDEYETYGVDGNMVLLIEQSCDDDVEELYRGRLLFAKYEYFCGDECHVKVPVETTSDVMELRNKWDQKVNLLTDKAFDETTDLDPYDYLGFDITLPSKGIMIQDVARSDAAISTPVLGVVTTGGEGAMVELPFSKTITAELGSFYTPNQLIYTTYASPGQPNSPNLISVPGGWYAAPLDISPTINYADGMPNFGQVTDTVEISVKIAGTLNVVNCELTSIYYYLLRLPDWSNGLVAADYTVLHISAIRPHAFPGVFSGAITFNVTFSDPAFVLNEGDRIYSFFAIEHDKTSGQVASGTEAFSLTFDSGNYFIAKTLSHTPASTSKAFMVNEAISRISETITNDKIRAYSDYFGRVDAMPYASADDGCGALEVITKGMFVRKQENRIADKPFLMTQSMKDMWEGLDPIHHIGFGIEPDENRAGYRWLRVEPWKYFYKDEVVMSCVEVNKIERKAVESEHYSTFKFGYEKWEAEEYNGLDEFLTKRTYRTTLNQVKNELTKLSKFIASGYAIEVTRRKGSNDSKDWRYDNDTFIICVTRSTSEAFIVGFGTTGLILWTITTAPAWAVIGATITVLAYETDGVTPIPANNITITITGIADYLGNVVLLITPGFTDTRLIATARLSNPNINKILVEQANVENSENIIDPDTVYNFRISPVRNGMRWVDKVFSGYRLVNDDSKIIFTEGDGNYYAEGSLTEDDCNIDYGVIKENQTIDLDAFLDFEKGIPLLRPERVVYEYPMSLKDFKDVMANPYGLIEFNNDCEDGDGWIDDIKYKPEEGIATFNLIPRHGAFDYSPCLITILDVKVSVDV
jgi:hypothetical protein